MSKQLRVCFIAGTLGQGGAERQLLYMVNALSNMNVQCQVLSLDKNQFYHSLLMKMGVPVLFVGRFKSRAIRLSQIIWVVRRWQPDIVQAVHLYTNLYAAFAAPFADAISIGANRGNIVHETNSLGYLGKLSLRWPNAIITNSAYGYQVIKKTALSKAVYLLENAVDCDYFRPATIQGPDQSTHILAVGRLVELKRHDLILRSVAEARKVEPNLHLRIVGDGPQRSRLECLAVELGLQPYVRFLGAQSDMVAVYQNSDLLIHTSQHEGTPNVILEAMACGLPVITTPAGEVPGLVEDGITGYVTVADDEKPLAKAIVDLAEHPHKRRQMGEDARVRVEEKHSLEKLGTRLLEIYMQVRVTQRWQK